MKPWLGERRGLCVLFHVIWRRWKQRGFHRSLETNSERTLHTGREQSSNTKNGAEGGIRSSLENRSTSQPEFSVWSTAKASRPVAKSPQRKPGGVGGSSPPHSVFPRWLLREMESRQLASADPSTLERRREEAEDWIKKEVLNFSSGWELTVIFFPGVVDHRWLTRRPWDTSVCTLGLSGCCYTFLVPVVAGRVGWRLLAMLTPPARSLLVQIWCAVGGVAVRHVRRRHALVRQGCRQPALEGGQQPATPPAR